MPGGGEYSTLLLRMKAAGHNTLFGIAQGTLLVVVRDTQDICKTVKLPMVLVPGLKRNLFFTTLSPPQSSMRNTIPTNFISF